MNLDSLSSTSSATTSTSSYTSNASLASSILAQLVQQNTHAVSLDHLMPSSPTLQTAQLRKPAKYYYGYKQDKKVVYYKHLFPITKKQNKWLIKGQLTATFSTPPSNIQIAEVLKQNLKVYERESGQEAEVLKKIEDVFYYADYTPVTVDINKHTSDEQGHHFKFTLSLIFGSASAKKAKKVFWTVKLKDLILAQDVIVEHNADMRDKKMDAACNPKTKGPYFQKWEKDVCWYDDYLKKFEEPELDETNHPQTQLTLNSIDDSSSTTPSHSSRKHSRRIEEEGESDDDESWTPPHTSFSSPSSSPRAKRLRHAATAVEPAESTSAPSSRETISQIQTIQDLVPTILENLVEHGKQVEQLKQQLQCSEKEKEKLVLEVTAVKGLLAVCTPLPSRVELQADLDKMTTQHRELQQAHREQATQLEEAKRKLQELEKIKSAFDQLKEDHESLNRRLARKQQALDDVTKKRDTAEISLKRVEDWWKQALNGSQSSFNHHPRSRA